MSNPYPPVIIIGMHRSGTSLVTRMLEELGLFVGRRKDINNEAWFFLRLNDWLLRQCGGGWDNPAPVGYLLDNPLGRRAVGDYLRFMLGTPRTASYLGVGGYLRYRRISRLNRPWGWKDPRNTFTLPLWRDLFPDARVIHVYRHGVDVAASLLRRQTRSVERAEQRFRRNRLVHALLPKQGGFAESWRCGSLDDALALWSEYTGEARRHAERQGERMIEVRYEDLLEHPARELTALARFCGLSPDAGAVEAAAGRIRSSRALAFQSDPRLRDLAQRRRRELSVFGY